MSTPGGLLRTQQGRNTAPTRFAAPSRSRTVKAVDGLFREVRAMTVAFVCQGGASLSAAQVGMLRGLIEAGVKPDLIVGTSAGAINAVAFAQDPTLEGLDRLQRLWCDVR